jgi:hypothetical protein
MRSENADFRGQALVSCGRSSSPVSGHAQGWAGVSVERGAGGLGDHAPLASTGFFQRVTGFRRNCIAVEREES